MATIVTRAGKGSPLTHNEVDANFNNLNSDKYQSGDSPTFGDIAVTGTVDGRDVAADGTKLDGIEAGADVTDTANVTAAGALMDSELSNITAVKALDQGVATTDSPSFAGLTVDTNTLYVDSTNNRVGIGTSSPSKQLEVAAASYPAIVVKATGTTSGDASVLRTEIAGTTASGFLHFGDADDLDVGYIQYNHSPDIMAFGVNAAERMRIDSSGRVGIGTSSPSANNLELAHASTPSMYLTDTGGGQAEVASYNGILVLGADRDGTQGGADIIFRSSGTTERLRIGSAGQLGIGGANYGTSGQVLTSNGTGSAPSWAEPVAATMSPSTATELSSSVDLDDLAFAEAGFYYQTHNADTTGNNYPSGQAGSLLVQKSANEDYGATQLYQTYDSSPDLYFRSKYNAGYSSWNKVAHSGQSLGDVGTYAWLMRTSSTANVTAGATVAGSGLFYAGFSAAAWTVSTTNHAFDDEAGDLGMGPGTSYRVNPSGTWRACGTTAVVSSYGYSSTLWVRIS